MFIKQTCDKLMLLSIVFAVFVVPELSLAAEGEQSVKISSIETAGNVYITKSKILSVVRSRPGQLFSIEAASEDVKRIAKIKGIEYAYYNITNVNDKIKLTFVVNEKNVIRKITFTGDKKYSQKALTSKLGFGRGDYLDKFTASAGAEKLKEYYNKKGYPFAQVSYDDSQIALGKLEYNIERGNRIKIRKTFFSGNNNIKKRELIKVVKSKPKSFLVIQNYYKEEVVKDDTIKLQKAYDKKGYLDTKVDADTKFVKDNKKADITFNIIEGNQYDVAAINISGNEFFDDANLSDESRLKVGQFYSDEKADYDREEILNEYTQAGFVDAVVKNKRRFVGNDKIIADFEISEGKRYRIGKINISGNKNVQDRVVRRAMDEINFTPGQYYDAYAAKGDGQGKLEKRIKADIYAESVSITPTGDSNNVKNAEVRIKEGKTGSVLFGAGISSTDGAIGQIVYDQRNFDRKKWPKDWRKFFSDKEAFKGAGQRFRIALEPGTELSRYSISFTEPYLNDKPTSMTLSGSSWERERENHNEARLKGLMGFKKRLKQGKFRTLGFRFENVSIESIDSDAPKELKDVKGDNILAGISIGFGRDKTDNRTNPTKGYNYEWGYEQVGGDHVFGVLTGTYRRYYTVHEDLARRKTILETKFHGGYIVGDAPLFEKFYAGGSGSVRGFDYRGISKRSGVDKDPIGSDWIGTANIELVVPMISDNFAGLLFTDAGIIDTGGVRASVGIGVQIMIPQWFGQVPMRFELATPIIKDGDDETQVFSFSVGRLF